MMSQCNECAKQGWQRETIFSVSNWNFQYEKSLNNNSFMFTFRSSVFIIYFRFSFAILFKLIRNSLNTILNTDILALEFNGHSPILLINNSRKIINSKRMSCVKPIILIFNFNFDEFVNCIWKCETKCKLKADNVIVSLKWTTIIPREWWNRTLNLKCIHMNNLAYANKSAIISSFVCVNL